MKVLTAASTPLLQSALRVALAEVEDIDVVATVNSTAGIPVAIRRSAPQVLICGTAFPDGRTVDIIADVLRQAVRVLVVCEQAAAEQAGELLVAGATGCLYVEDCSPAELVVAVRQVAAGTAALHPAAAEMVLRRWRAERAREARPVPGQEPLVVALTVRESEVLHALSRGLPTKSISRELGVSPKTVEAHVTRVLGKLGARNRAQAVALADSRGLLLDPSSG